jgi:hypothetical protein
MEMLLELAKDSSDSGSLTSNSEGGSEEVGEVFELEKSLTIDTS